MGSGVTSQQCHPAGTIDLMQGKHLLGQIDSLHDNVYGHLLPEG